MVKFVFAARPVSVYRDKVIISVPLKIAAAAAPGMRNLRGRVHYQACNERSCLIPADASFDLTLVVGDAGAGSGSTALTHDNAGGWGRRLQNASLFWQLVLAFIGGLLLNLTPCVYPMIPITLGYFGAQSEGRIGKTFGLAVFYVLGLSIVYSLLGVFAARTGALFGSTLQNPYVVGAVALVLFALGLSMIGAFTLQPPRFFLNRSGAKRVPGARWAWAPCWALWRRRAWVRWWLRC
jgi:thiol:disulfide interchange protein DsbD